MKNTKANQLIRKYFLFSLFLSFPILLLFPFQSVRRRTTGPPPGNQRSGDLRISLSYNSYEAYLQRQLNKTLNPKLRKIWTTRDWDRKINVFARFFQHLKQKQLLKTESKALCIGARMGQEVEALRRVGVADSVGTDLVPYPPLVLKGDLHDQPFENDTFDFEFSNVFDRALYPEKFVGEIERTLKPGGVCVLHVVLSRRSDKYSADYLYSVRQLTGMFGMSELVQVRNVDGFGLDTEVVFRRNIKQLLIRFTSRIIITGS